MFGGKEFPTVVVLQLDRRIQ